MPADLINITNIVLSDDFETWFERTNEIIDALNPLQLYDFYDLGYTTSGPWAGVAPTITGYTTVTDITPGTTLGLKITRDIRYDGDMLIEILPEAPLGFNTTTGALALVWTGPLGPPLISSCGTLANDDLFLLYDVSAALTKTVEAQYSLPPLVKCDHQFGEAATPVTITIKGDLVVDGTQTILSTANVSSQDKNIDLNAAQLEITDASNYVSGEDLLPGETVTGAISLATGVVGAWIPAAVGFPGSILTLVDTSGTPFTAGETITGGTSGWSITEGGQVVGAGIPAGDDTIADGGGITLLSSDGNKNITWQNAGDRWYVNQSWEVDLNFTVFTTTIEPQTGILSLQGGAGGPYPMTVELHDTTDPNFPTATDDFWEWRVRKNPPPLQVGYSPGSYPTFGSVLAVDEGTLSLIHTAPNFGPSTNILFDSISITYDPFITGFARHLNADLLDGAHATEVPTANMIPIALATGLLDPGWLPYVDNLVMQVNQATHGFVVGNVVRLKRSPETPLGDYILAQADTADNAEAVGVVSVVVDANNFELTLRGFITLTTGEWDAVTGAVGGLTPGHAYFLDKTTAGELTTTTPGGGEISKTMLVAIDTTDAIVMNYVGGLVDPFAGTTPSVTLVGDVLAGPASITGPITTTIVERTNQIPAAAGPTPLIVEDETGAGHRSFEIMLVGHASLDLVQPTWPSVPGATNSVTLIITQDGIGGWTPTITVGGGTVIWDNSLVQPPHQTIANKTTIYVLVNVDGSTVWYGSRAVFEL